MAASRLLQKPLGSASSFGRTYELVKCGPLRGNALRTSIGTRATRFKTTEAGENKTGHIEAGPNESIFYLDNVFPLKFNMAMWLPFIDFERKILESAKHPRNAAAAPEDVAARALPDNLRPTEVLPRVREGGAFVKVQHDLQEDMGEEERRKYTDGIEKVVKRYLKENPIKPWFNPFNRVRTALVRGRPWLEDLHRLPDTRLKIEFLPAMPGQAAEELTQETIYSMFRRYGRLTDITPQPTDSKDVPKFAYVHFAKTRPAIVAKNCLHGYVLPEKAGGGKDGTMLKIGYEQRRRAHKFWEWLANHPRVVIPLMLAFAGAVTVAIFDPIRTFFIKAHVTRTFHLSDNRIYKWLRSQATRATDALNLKHRAPEDAGLRAIWDDRKDDIEQIQTWLMESADTFIVIQGPRGSGKRELVLDQALKGRKNNLLIDCKPIQEAKGDSSTINAAALEVGYRPVFSWMNSISSLIDLAAQGTIGTKTGFSETLDAQLAKIWQNTTSALKQVALDERSKSDKDADLGADEYLEAHPEKRPVVIIDNFLHKSQETSVVYDKIAEWAAGLTTANVAHVIFLTNDVSFSKSLSKALPDRVFRQIALGDCSPEVAKRFVINHLDADADDDTTTDNTPEKRPKPSQMRADLAELDDCISTLGGRLTDLEFLARRIKTGETPKKAVREITEQSASEILKMYILDSSARKWTPEQAWLLVRSLAQTDCLRYNEILLHDILKAGGEATLQALEQAELITIVSSNGRPTGIKPGKPVYAAAFRQLTDDRVLAAKLDLAILNELVRGETAGIEKCELELERLGRMEGGIPKEARGRTRYLLGKLAGSQEKIEGWEGEGGGLKKVLVGEF